MVIRLDDISPNTKSDQLDEICSVIKNFLPDANIWLGVNLFAKYDANGAVYPDLPLKNKRQNFFWGVDRVLHCRDFSHQICSHGLWHFDHSSAGAELQEASIITSCRLLRANIFIPPFNRWNHDTAEICQRNGIALVKSEEEGWKSFEFNEFDPKHEFWYMHPWKWDSKKLSEFFSLRTEQIEASV